MSDVDHRLVVRHPSRPAVLVVDGADGPRLPRLTLADRHTADAEYINAAVRERFGLVTTVLRSLAHTDPSREPVERSHELEAHDDVSLGWSDLRWADETSLACLADEADREAIGDWRAGAGASAERDGCDWMRAGWFADAVGWITERVAATGGGTVHEVVQLRAWHSSCVLKARAATAEYYFKAVPMSLGAECFVTSYLSEHFPGAVPPVVAMERERRWMLTRACGGRHLETIDDPGAWERAVARYGELQVACVPRAADLEALGCRRREPAVGASLESLLGDHVAMGIGRTGGLTAGDAAELEAALPALRRAADDLRDAGVPVTLDHGDLWPSNVLVGDDGCVIIDWEDAAVGPAFLSLAPLLAGLTLAQPALATPSVIDRLETAYLAAFTATMPLDALRRALAQAAPLAFVDMAVRYRRERPSVVRLHPWMRDLVPEALRLALDRLRTTSPRGIG